MSFLSLQEDAGAFFRGFYDKLTFCRHWEMLRSQSPAKTENKTIVTTHETHARGIANQKSIIGHLKTDILHFLCFMKQLLSQFSLFYRFFSNRLFQSLRLGLSSCALGVSFSRIIIIKVINICRRSCVRWRQDGMQGVDRGCKDKII